MTTDAPWVRLIDNGLCCTRCGRRLVLVMPIDVRDFLATGNAFLAEHAWCEAPLAAETREVGA